MPAAPLSRLRRICLALPETTEVLSWEHHPTFRVRDKIFALVGTHADAPAVWLKAPPGAQEVLVGADPARFFRPPYLGGRGWVGVVLSGRPDWTELEALVHRSYALVAPRRLARMLVSPASPPSRAPRPG